ncbi:MAG: thioredoxin domain-containing protein [bacterium]|nr:thioredoxin domain-containing protein [bacterium]
MRIPFYFDYACPWAYIGSCRVEAHFQDLGAEIDFRPVHLVSLAEPGAGKYPELGGRKQDNARNDIRHWAELVGAEISPDAARLRRTSTRLALKIALVAQDMGRFREFHYPTYRARWAEARDLSDETVLQELIRSADLDVDTVMQRATSDALTDRLERETNDAIRKGVFGVPTIFVGGEMFWGNDRFELVRHYLQKA